MPRILVIDDEEMVRLAIAVVSRGKGWEVEVAGDGQEGMEKARAKPPDVIVCDLNMPIMDGFEMLAAVRADPVLRKVRFVVITGLAGEEHAGRAVRAGADSVLLKPFSNSALVGMIEHQLQGSSSGLES